MPQNVDFTVLTVESGVEATARRLKVAFKQAGGRRRVSERTGIPERRLGSYLSGQMMKQDALVAIADACRVSVEWLATGRGQMVAGWVNTPAWPHEPFGPTPDGNEIVMGPAMPLPDRQKPPTSQITTTWPPLTDNDAGLVSAALSYARTAIQRGTAPVDAGLLLAALADFYSAFARLLATPQQLAAELDRLATIYVARGTAAAEAAAAPSSAASKNPLREAKSEPAPDALNDPVSKA